MKDDLPLLEIDLSIDNIKYDSISNTEFLTTIQKVTSEASKENFQKVINGNLKILLEKEQNIFAFYITRSDSEELRSKIHSLLNLFVSRYKNLLLDNLVDISLFEEFKEIILNFLSNDVIRDYYVIKPTDNPIKNSIPGKFWPIISSLNENRTVLEIAKKLNTDLEQVKKDIAFLKSKDLISFSIEISPFDIPFILPESISRLFDTNENYNEIISQLGINQFKIIKIIDAKSSVTKIAEENSLNLQDMIEILKILLTNGYIGILPEELKWCIIFENIYVLFTKLIKKFLGDIGIKIFTESIENETNPLVGLIKNTNYNTLSFEAVIFHVKNKKKINISEMFYVFLTPILSTIANIKPALDVLSSNYIIEFQNEFLNILENIKKYYGLKHLQKIKEYLNLV